MNKEKDMFEYTADDQVEQSQIDKNLRQYQNHIKI